MSVQQQSSSTLCNLLLEQSDLRKIEQLDPFQMEGFKTLSKISLPINIKYTDELGKQTSDKQNLTIQVLVKYVRQHKGTLNLQQIRIFITSETDLYLNFICNFNLASFDNLKVKNGLNLNFNDFPTTLVNILKNCESFPQKKPINEGQLRLTYEGTGKLFIFQQTQYKKIQLLQLFFSTSNAEKIQQSIIYRYNYQNTKLKMLQNTIESIYGILSKKNQPLLEFIQKNVGINQ